MNDLDQRRLVRLTVMLTALATARLAPAQVMYTFDHLVPGKLSGQDNWSGTANAVLEQGAGVNTSLVFNNTTAGLPQATASRINDGQFSFPRLTLDRTNVVVGFDFRLKSAAANCSADFLLAERDHGFTDHGKIGLRYDAATHKICVIRGDGAAASAGPNNFADVTGNWFRVWMAIDFSGANSDGVASLYFQNLTAGGSRFAPVASMQSLSLLLVSQGVDPSRWDRLDVRAANIQVDNLVVDFSTNTPPVLDPISEHAVAEGELLTLTATASDLQDAASALRFSLEPGAPVGASLSPAGVFTWTPLENQGPGTYWIFVRVTDNGFPPLSAVRQFTVTVSEVNRPPFVEPIPDKAITEGAPVTFQLKAKDYDDPVQTLAYALVAPVPVGATISPAGQFSWMPTGPGLLATNKFTVVVRDDGTPSLSATQSFAVVVNRCPVPASPVVPRPFGSGLKVSAETLLGADPDGDALSLTSVNSTSAAGGTVTINEGWVFYTPPPGLAADDSFGYTVADTGGGTASGVVTVALSPDLQPSPNLNIVNLGNGTFRLLFDGVPGITYRIQFAESLTAPVWSTLGSDTANASGVFLFTDTPPAGTLERYYRSVYP